MELYGYFRSSAAYRVRIALALKGLDFDNIPINLVPGISEQRSKGYLAINPQGRVPFFTDGDVGISQSPAILEYLDEVYPQVPLLPSDATGRATVRQLASLIGCDIHPLQNVSVLQRLKGEFDADSDAVIAWVQHWIREGFSAFEALIANASGSFCFGDTVSLADVYLVPQVYNARRYEISLEAFPEIVRIDHACNQLKAFQQAAPENQPDAPAV